MVGCVFLSQNWAPLVKKIHKWLAAFFCPKKWAPLVKKKNGWHVFFCQEKKLFTHSNWKTTNLKMVCVLSDTRNH